MFRRLAVLVQKTGSFSSEDWQFVFIRLTVLVQKKGNFGLEDIERWGNNTPFIKTAICCILYSTAAINSAAVTKTAINCSAVSKTAFNSTAVTKIV